MSKAPDATDAFGKSTSSAPLSSASDSVRPTLRLFNGPKLDDAFRYENRAALGQRYCRVQVLGLDDEIALCRLSDFDLPVTFVIEVLLQDFSRSAERTAANERILRFEADEVFGPLLMMNSPLFFGHVIMLSMPTLQQHQVMTHSPILVGLAIRRILLLTGFQFLD